MKCSLTIWGGRPCKAIVAAAACVLVACAGCGPRREPVRDAPDTAAIGSFGRNPGQFSSPRAVACDAKGNVAAVDKTGRVQVFDKTGKLVTHWRMPDTGKGTPTGITFDPKGDLLIADTHYHRVIKYSTKGDLLTQFGSYGEGDGQFIYPTDVAVAKDGAVLVAEYGKNDRVSVFDASYRFVTQWGGHGAEEGHFRRPMGLAIDAAGAVYVADAVNHRIQKFSPSGKFLVAWGGPGE